MSACQACGSLNIEGADHCERCGQPMVHLAAPLPNNQLARSVLQDRISLLAPKKPVTASPDATLGDVLQTLVSKRIGCVVLVDSHGLPCGIFTERDVLQRVGENASQLAGRPIRDFMTANPECLNVEDPIAFALHRMDVGGYRHIPITRKGRLEGVISIRDVLKYCGRNVLDAD